LKQPLSHLIILFVILIIFSLACNLTSTANLIKSTAEGAATKVEEGRGLLSTGEAIVTQIEGSGISETAQAWATQIADSGFKETGQALATQYVDSGIQETVQAYATEFKDSHILETAQAVSTQFSLSPENKPEDIPVLEGEKNAFITSPYLISYFIKVPFDEALAFYQREMPANGWNVKENTTVISKENAEISYEKGNLSAKVTISALPIINQISIIIDIKTTE
jgi:hypothetical protein